MSRRSRRSRPLVGAIPTEDSCPQRQSRTSCSGGIRRRCCVGVSEDPHFTCLKSAGKVVGFVQHGPVGASIHEVYASYVEPATFGKGIGWTLW